MFIKYAVNKTPKNFSILTEKRQRNDDYLQQPNLPKTTAIKPTTKLKPKKRRKKK